MRTNGARCSRRLGHQPHERRICALGGRAAPPAARRPRPHWPRRCVPAHPRWTVTGSGSPVSADSSSDGLLALDQAVDRHHLAGPYEHDVARPQLCRPAPPDQIAVAAQERRRGARVPRAPSTRVAHGRSRAPRARCRRRASARHRPGEVLAERERPCHRDERDCIDTDVTATAAIAQPTTSSGTSISAVVAAQTRWAGRSSRARVRPRRRRRPATQPAQALVLPSASRSICKRATRLLPLSTRYCASTVPDKRRTRPAGSTGARGRVSGVHGRFVAREVGPAIIGVLVLAQAVLWIVAQARRRANRALRRAAAGRRVDPAPVDRARAHQHAAVGGGMVRRDRPGRNLASPRCDHRPGPAGSARAAVVEPGRHRARRATRCDRRDRPGGAGAVGDPAALAVGGAGAAAGPRARVPRCTGRA